MNLLFIQGGSRVRTSINGKNYVDGNFNNDIWKRYASYSDNLTVILRKIDSLYNIDELKVKFNEIDESILDLKLVEDIYSPRRNFFNWRIRKNISKIIRNEVKRCDKIIIRSIGNFYTNTALKYCKKYKKDYLIEVTGFAFEGLWYHSLLGKIVAIPRELKLKKEIKNAPFAVYVTKDALQKRYPCKNKVLGCSDVEIIPSIKKNIDTNKKIIKIGTLAFLDVKWKGQIDVLKAMHVLKQNDELFFEYELVGSGSGNLIKKYIDRFDLKDEVKIIGVKPHTEVFEWLKTLDIYIQPSYQEGLCRALVESMSVGCPIVATNVGGNYELIDEKYIYKKGNIDDLLSKLNVLKDDKERIIVSQINYEKSKKYNKEILDKERDSFYLKFCKG